MDDVVVKDGQGFFINYKYDDIHNYFIFRFYI